MIILVVGDGHSAIHEKAVSKAFNSLGHKAEVFYWYKYFFSENKFKKYLFKFQNKFLIGPLIKKLNTDFYNLAKKSKPEMIFVYRGTHIFSKTLKDIKKIMPDCEIYGYNNDDPFSKKHPFWLWRHFKKCVQLYDIMFAYRHQNLNDYKKKGAKNVELLRSWFNPDLNLKTPLSRKDESQYSCDVVFIGHYEKDGRLEYLEEIVKAGYKLKIFGPPYEWNKLILKSKILKNLYPINLVWNINYSKALSAAKIGLCFLSKINRDTYTRRCFEIPATETMLLSEYSKDLTTIFKNGIEIETFKTKKEMLSKIKFYIKNSENREKLAKMGNKKVISDGHDINSRMKIVLNCYRYRKKERH